MKAKIIDRGSQFTNRRLFLSLKCSGLLNSTISTLSNEQRCVFRSLKRDLETLNLMLKKKRFLFKGI